MIVAVVVIILHLVVGLGFLWPIVAVAGWGAAAVLIPDNREHPGPASIQAGHLQPRELANKLRGIAQDLYGIQPPNAIVDSMASLNNSLNWILQEWDELDDVPETRVSITTIITEFLPGLVDSYRDIPDPHHPEAVEHVVGSLVLLEQEANATRQAIIDNNVRELEDHTRSLYLRLGKFPAEGDAEGDTVPTDSQRHKPGDTRHPEKPFGYDGQP